MQAGRVRRVMSEISLAHSKIVQAEHSRSQQATRLSALQDVLS
jgi:hypothetical protein